MVRHEYASMDMAAVVAGVHAEPVQIKPEVLVREETSLAIVPSLLVVGVVRLFALNILSRIQAMKYCRR